jgi:hypothetical protein
MKAPMFRGIRPVSYRGPTDMPALFIAGSSSRIGENGAIGQAQKKKSLGEARKSVLKRKKAPAKDAFS